MAKKFPYILFFYQTSVSFINNKFTKQLKKKLYIIIITLEKNIQKIILIHF